MTKTLNQMLVTVTICAVGVLGALVWTGCDVSSSNDALNLSPTSAVLSPGESVEFTVSGGYDYTWSLSPDDGSGSLSATTGSRVTYTCVATNVGSTPKYVVVTSTIQGSSSSVTTTDTSSTNSTTTTTDGYSVSATASIFYDGGTGSSSDLSVDPTSVTISTNASQTFTVSGGSGSYGGTVGDTSLGSFTSTSSSTFTYTAGSTVGTNTLTFTDSSSNSVTATVYQQ